MSKAYGWSNAGTIVPFRYSILFLSPGMIVGGIWQDRSGPRIAATAGGVLPGIGWVLSGAFGSDPAVPAACRGCLVGFGTGSAYVAPIATPLKWFPDKRGLMVGLALAGAEGPDQGVAPAT